MRVLFINPYFVPDYAGGAEASVQNSAAGLQRRGHDCTILIANHRQTTAVDQWYSVDNVPVHRVTFNQWLPLQDIFDFRIYKLVCRQIRELKPDIVHIHNASGMSLSPYVACKHMGVPVVNTLHDLWLLCPNNMRYRKDGSFCNPKQFPSGCNQCFRKYVYWGAIPYRKQTFQALTSNVAKFISPSFAVIERHVEAGYDRQRFVMIPNGIVEEITTKWQNPQIAEIQNTGANYRTIVYAGGGIEIKGAQVLLDALPTLFETFKNLRVVVTGGGEGRYLTQFRQYEPRVILFDRLGFAEMRQVFACSDLTVVPSTWHETSSIVTLENFHLGTPAIGSNFGGIPELIDEDKTGYLFQTGDSNELAKKVIHHFQKSPLQRRQMRHECIKVARGCLHLDQHLAKLMMLYDEVLNKNS